MKYAFDPVFDKNSLVLILGSFPSVKSLEMGFYYGNKQNKFWKVLENIFQTKIGDNIEAKKDFLLKKHIALFDIIQGSDLIGSSDKNLEKSQYKISDISKLLPPNTKVIKILCNGKTAFNLTSLNMKTTLPIIYLPSTSPANVTFDISTWKKELSFLI